MNSKIAAALNLKFLPVAIMHTNEKPQKAVQFKPGKWACVMFMFAAAAHGKTAVFDKHSYGCWGGGVGLGFGLEYTHFPGGVDCFARFLSSGNSQWAPGQAVAENMAGKVSAELMDHFLHGEGYIKTPELVHEWLKALPIMEIENKYVVFKPLNEVDFNTEQPESVVFLANADQLSALVILANYGRPGMNNVIIPWAAACQNIGIMVYAEARSENPRAVVGMTDISARKHTRKTIGPDYLSFAMPWTLFQEMEENVDHSFLTRHLWQSLRDN